MTRNQAMMLAFTGFVLVFSVATLLFWEIMRDTILVPVYYFLWVSGLMVNSVPQGAYWALLTLVSLIIGLKTVSSLRAMPSGSPVIQYQMAPSTRYHHWSRLCDHAYGNTFYQSQFVLDARKLILSILAYEQGVDLVEAEALVRNGMLEIPDALRDIIESKYRPASRLPGCLASALSRLRQLLLRTDTSPDPHFERLMAEFISFVEHHLEIPHAGNNPES